MRSLFASMIFALTLLLATPQTSQATQNDARLQALKNADQADRSGDPTKIDWREVSARDRSRRDDVIKLFKAGNIVTAVDHYNAAMVLQHGSSPDDYQLAHAFATLAVTLDPDFPAAKWLMAASWDRYLQSMKQPQWYGTQFTRDAKGRTALYPVAVGAVTDEERKALSVPSLYDAQRRAAMTNTAAQ